MYRTGGCRIPVRLFLQTLARPYFDGENRLLTVKQLHRGKLRPLSEFAQFGLRSAHENTPDSDLDAMKYV